MWKYNYPNELYHHGILGMKWGIRRFQNKDGSLTAAGKKRAQQDLEEASDDYKKAHTSKNIKKMSNQELNDVNKRLQMEKEYSKLTNKNNTAGKKFVSGVLLTAATTIAGKYATKYMDKGVEYITKKITKNSIKNAAAATVVANQIRKFKP